MVDNIGAKVVTCPICGKHFDDMSSTERTRHHRECRIEQLKGDYAEYVVWADAELAELRRRVEVAERALELIQRDNVLGGWWSLTDNFDPSAGLERKDLVSMAYALAESEFEEASDDA